MPTPAGSLQTYLLRCCESRTLTRVLRALGALLGLLQPVERLASQAVVVVVHLVDEVLVFKLVALQSNKVRQLLDRAGTYIVLLDQTGESFLLSFLARFADHLFDGVNQGELTWSNWCRSLSTAVDSGVDGWVRHWGSGLNKRNNVKLFFYLIIER